MQGINPRLKQDQLGPVSLHQSREPLLKEVEVLLSVEQLQMILKLT